MKNKTPAVFFDRDGTLINEACYLKDVKDLKLFKNTALALKKLNDKNIPAIMVSNQAGVARGYFTEETVQFLNGRLNDLLKDQNAHLDGFYYCPHHPEGNIPEYAINCDCRKPLIGMIKQAFTDFPQINIEKSYVIGDKTCDIELGKNAGCKSVLVRTGYGKDVKMTQNLPDFIADDLEQAVDWILEDLGTKTI
ncbi:MAG: HAD family hydrolase [Candidatus Gastranaerophilaceae bacterium]|jgi:D-glycero-D-manno-heptose 1,7-bisphosphate phosphatase